MASIAHFLERVRHSRIGQFAWVFDSAQVSRIRLPALCPVAGTRVSLSASSAHFPWTILPTDVTMAAHYNDHLRRFDLSHRGTLS